jgi:hypothetical protein
MVALPAAGFLLLVAVLSGRVSPDTGTRRRARTHTRPPLTDSGACARIAAHEDYWVTGVHTLAPPRPPALGRGSLPWAPTPPASEALPALSATDPPSTPASTSWSATTPDPLDAALRWAWRGPPLMALADDARALALGTLGPLHQQYLAATPGLPVPTLAAPERMGPRAVFAAALTRSYDDLAVPVVPLTDAERALAPAGRPTPLTEGLITLEEDGVYAIGTELQWKGRGFNYTGNATVLSQRSSKYCGRCGRYLASIPNRGARLGHYMHNWCAAGGCGKELW